MVWINRFTSFVISINGLTWFNFPTCWYRWYICEPCTSWIRWVVSVLFSSRFFLFRSYFTRWSNIVTLFIYISNITKLFIPDVEDIVVNICRINNKSFDTSFVCIKTRKNWCHDLLKFIVRIS